LLDGDQLHRAIRLEIEAQKKCRHLRPMLVGKQKSLIAFSLADEIGPANVKPAREPSLGNVKFADCIAVKHRIEIR